MFSGTDRVTKMTKKYIYLDCDTGIDDALALAYLLAEKEHVELVGVGTVCGNIDAPTGAQNTINLLALAGRDDIPVAIGAQNYLTSTYSCHVQHIHGDNGIGNVDLPQSAAKPIAETAPEFLVRLARQYAGQLHIVAIGPLTNIAKALDIEPALSSLIEGITMMGGAANAPGNMSPVAEANIMGDPEAADRVFSLMDNIVMVPLDLTMMHLFEEADQDALLKANGSLAQALGHILPIYMDFYKDIYGRRCCALHDPAAAILAVHGLDRCLAPKVKVSIDSTNGPGRGQTICDLRGKYNGYPVVKKANCHVVLSTDLNISAFLLEKIRQL